MISWLCYLVGVDYSKIKSGKNILLFFSLVIVFTLCLAAFGFYFAIYNTTESVFLGILLGLFFSLFILNIYRLVFSISEGELNKYDKFWDVTKFVLKRGFILIALSLFISNSLEVYIYKHQLDFHLLNYKKDLKKDFNKTVELGLLKEKMQIFEEYNRKVSDDKLFDRFSELKRDNYINEKETKLIALQQKIDLKNRMIEKKISESNFFITKIKLLYKHVPESLFVTLIIISIFLSPFYVFLLTPLFTKYDTECANDSRQIITEEYNYFKELYSKLMVESTGNKLEFDEKYEDPPFNKIKIKPSYKILKKGSLLKWIELFN
jgi:hypothetical protein